MCPIVDEIIDENKYTEFTINEDDNINDLLDELHEKMYNDKLSQEEKPKEDTEEQDDGYYFINLINIFTKYYNNKFEKNENFFNDIKKNSDTSNQMELFFECTFEHNVFKEKNNLSNEECFKYYFNNDDKKNIKKLFDDNNKIYVFEHNNNKIVFPTLLICLNYIHENKIINDEWGIYDLNNK